MPREKWHCHCVWSSLSAQKIRKLLLPWPSAQSRQKHLAGDAREEWWYPQSLECVRPARLPSISMPYHFARKRGDVQVWGRSTALCMSRCETSGHEKSRNPSSSRDRKFAVDRTARTTVQGNLKKRPSRRYGVSNVQDPVWAVMRSKLYHHDRCRESTPPSSSQTEAVFPFRFAQSRPSSLTLRCHRGSLG